MCITIIHKSGKGDCLHEKYVYALPNNYNYSTPYLYVFISKRMRQSFSIEKMYTNNQYGLLIIPINNNTETKISRGRGIVNHYFMTYLCDSLLVKNTCCFLFFFFLRKRGLLVVKKLRRGIRPYSIYIPS